MQNTTKDRLLGYLANQCNSFKTLGAEETLLGRAFGEGFLVLDLDAGREYTDLRSFADGFGWRRRWRRDLIGAAVTI